MKCIKNSTTGNIIRVEDKQAFQIVGNTWKYVSKDEWRKYKTPQVVETQHEFFESKILAAYGRLK